MNATDRFEIVADLFYADTGCLRPGKSVPCVMASEEYEQRRQDAWKEWNTAEQVADSAIRRIYELEERVKKLEMELE